MKFDALDLEPDLNRVIRSYTTVHSLSAYLILQIVPPVRPRLFDTSFLFEDRFLDHGTQNAECHSDSVVVITVDVDSSLKFVDRFSINLEAIV